MSRAILQVTIRGRVQGVGYRAWVEVPGQRERPRRLGPQPPRRQRRGAVRRPRRCRRRHGQGVQPRPISARVDRVQEDVGASNLLDLRGEGERFAFLPTVCRAATLAGITRAWIFPSMGPLPKRRANSSAALCCSFEDRLTLRLDLAAHRRALASRRS